MKKLVALLLAFSSIFTCFSACRESESSCKHTYEYNCNEGAHQKSYTCGCSITEEPEIHIDSDYNDVCDVCGYHFIMVDPPMNHFLRNQAGCEWMNEITDEDVAEIKIITETVGVAPGTFKDIATTIDEDVIARIFEAYYWMDTAPISREEGQIDGGGAVTVKFILKNGYVKKLFVNNGNYCDTNGEYFELLYIPKFEETENYVSSYGFINNKEMGALWSRDTNGGESQFICEIPMDELEFAELTDEIVLEEKEITHYIESEIGKLYFLSEMYFYIEGMVEGNSWNEIKSIYYQLHGKNLDELIAEYTIILEE